MRHTEKNKHLGVYFVFDAEMRTASNGNPYVNFSARSREGKTYRNCKRWRFDKVVSGVFDLFGSVEEYKGSEYLQIGTWTANTEVLADEFVPVAPWPLDLETLKKTFNEYLTVISSDDLRRHTLDLIKAVSERSLVKSTPSPCKSRFWEYPGSHAIHHAYRHGLLEHTNEVLELTRVLCGQHGVSARERDLALAGAALHDIGKLETTFVEGGVYSHPDLSVAYGGNTNAHLYIGGQMLLKFGRFFDADFQVLQNILLSHHGSFGDVPPRYLVSVLVHYADAASAAGNRMRLALAQDDKKKVTDSTNVWYYRIGDYKEPKK